MTAGVLRGQKGRFQLFGDAVNTAARMEHTGLPGKIHASESFAKALRAAGKENWLVAREDKVFAKGLGTLETFWILPSVQRSSITSSEISSFDGMSVDSEGYVPQLRTSVRDFDA